MHRPTFIMMGSRMMAAISPWILFEAALDGGEIVKRGDKDIGNCGLGNAEAAGHGDRIVDVAEFGSVRLDAD